MTLAHLPTHRVVRTRGRYRKYDTTVIVQMLADGHGMQRIAHDVGTSLAALTVTLRQMKVEHKVNKTPQLVAHYLRNGWID